MSNAGLCVKGDLVTAAPQDRSKNTPKRAPTEADASPVLQLRPPLEGRGPSPGSLGSLLVGPETDLDFLLIEDFFASIVIFSQEAS